MTHRLDEIKAKEETWTSLESAIVFTDSHGSVNLAYRAAQDLENMEYEIKNQSAELLKLREDLHAVADLKDEIALALEVASIARVWGNPSPFQDKINELLVKAGRKPISPDKAFTLPK